MKPGDKVRRKKEFQSVNNWRYEDRVFVVQKTTLTQIFIEDVGWDMDKFELILDDATLEGQLQGCVDIIGKRVEYFMDGELECDVVLSFQVVTKFENLKDYSDMVQDALQNAIAVVVLFGEMGMNIPYTAVTRIKEESITIKLNETYKAEVFKDKIVVGCQTFPINILDQLMDAYDKL